MGSGNCKALCPEATNKNGVEIVSDGIIVDPNQISLIQRREKRNTGVSSEAGKQNKANDFDNISESPSTRNINGEPAPVVQSRYVANHIVVPVNIIKKKLTDPVRTFLKKQLAESPLLSDGSSWYLIPSGNYYSGEFQAGKPGIGTYLLANGNVYYGKSLNDKPDGLGVLITDKGILKGSFKEGHAVGKCRLQTKNIIADGQWKEGYLIEGKIDSKEWSYQGSIENGVPEKKGTYKNLVSEISYQGDFKKGMYDGTGILKTPEYVYKGQFRQGKKHGFGTLEFHDRKKHPDMKIGQWEKDVLLA